jgi:hypothetical protein
MRMRVCVWWWCACGDVCACARVMCVWVCGGDVVACMSVHVFQVLKEYALLVLTARRCGLHVSLSRMVHFGPIPETLARACHVVNTVDSAM